MSTVHRQHLTGNPVSIVGNEETHRLGNICGLPTTSKGDLFVEGLLQLRGYV